MLPVIFQTQAPAPRSSMNVEVIGHQFWWEFPVLTVTPQLQDQQLYFPGAVAAGPTYWEGAVDVHANGAGPPTGVGYVELTGYAPPVPSSQ